GCIVITGALEVLPEGLRPVLASLKLAPPDAKEYRSLLGRILRDVSRSMRVRMALPAKDLQRLLANLRGLTLLEAEKVLTKAVVEDGLLDVEAITKVIEAKKAIVEREGLLEYYPSQEPLDSIAGMAGLKDWLAKRRGIITEPERAAEYGLGFPKGVLLLGVQGCGKSLFAKAVSAEWGLPLLKLDPSNLYNKYVGESEKNFARAVRIAERLAPVVLWIDEIEKAFAQSGSTDDGISQRILGSFLSWLQERKGDVFVVATANDIARLPPEFIRKGRFDEIFFVDLPSAPAREAILGIHLSKRGQKPGLFDLPALARATEGFSGAEIEQVVVAALYTAFASGSRLDTGQLLREASKTFPLSKTMREKVEALREWA
ncbi:MAG: AAA family ATPase, partial [Elusimicrobiota bacterium]